MLFLWRKDLQLKLAIMNFNGDRIEEYGETVNALQGMGVYAYAPNKLDLDLKYRPTLLAKPLIK